MIAIIGLGFVGLTTALGFAEKGYKVYGFDIDRKKMDRFHGKELPFHEPFLREQLNKHLDKSLMLSDNLEETLKNSQYVFFCVGTPCLPDGNANLEVLTGSINECLKFCKKGVCKDFIIKSTVPPSTTAGIIKSLIEKAGFTVGQDIGLANNPEFLREGHAWDDFINPDRVVIGTDDRKTGDQIAMLYAPFGAPVYIVSMNTAEFIKYLSNTLLSSMISFSNEMSMIADAIGDINIPESFNILHQDKRWSGNPAKMTTYVYPGCGFGGYCLPKDTLALCSISKCKGYDPALLKEVLTINEKIKKHISGKIITASKKDECIGILGLSFKANSDDVRDTPSKDIISQLLLGGRKNIIAYDPIASESFKKAYGLAIRYAKTMEEIIRECRVISILTSWDEFKTKKHLFTDKTVIDGRHLLGALPVVIMNT